MVMFLESNEKKQMREIKLQIAENQQLYQRVFNTEDGKAVLKDLEKRCFVKHTTLNDNHGQMGFAEGRRSVYFYITNLLERELETLLSELTKGE